MVVTGTGAEPPQQVVNINSLLEQKPFVFIYQGQCALHDILDGVDPERHPGALQSIALVVHPSGGSATAKKKNKLEPVHVIRQGHLLICFLIPRVALGCALLDAAAEVPSARYSNNP